MRQPFLLVVGSLNYDLILRHHRLPRAGESVIGAELTESCGGKGANQAIAAARFARAAGHSDIRISFAGAVGDDVYGRRQLGQLQADGIDIEGVRIAGGTSTGLSTIWVDSGSGENRILNAPGANRLLSPADVAALPIESAGLLLIQNEIPAATTRELCRLASAGGIPVLWDPAPFDGGDELPLEPGGVRYLTPNETEASALLGREIDQKTAAEDAAALTEIGFDTVLLTLGANGVAVADRDGARYRVDAPKVRAIDTTAAGDAFAGAFAASLLAGVEEGEAIRRSVAYASASVRVSGAQSSFPVDLD